MDKIKVRISGALACFSRPEMKVERVSYECMTPSAARGILDSILWKKEMRWHIRRIKLLKPIQFIPLKRNEVESKISYRGKKGVQGWMKDPTSFKPLQAGAGTEHATPRNTLALRDVAYEIEAEPIVFDNNGDNTPQKYISMFNRRVQKGQCYRRPSLGCREFVADFEPADENEKPISENLEIGNMLYDIIFDKDYEKNIPIFFNATVKNGVLNTSAEEVITDEEVRKEVLRCWFKL